MKKVKNDLTGKRFGRLTVIGIDDRGTRRTYYSCLCDCGKVKSVRSDSLLCGAIRSCGCMKKEQDEINLDRYEHGMSHKRIHDTWLGMKGRCNNIHDASYHRYGGRGIKVCEEWEHNFVAFYEWAISNGYDDSLTIDRIDNDGNYEPNNCRWVSAKEQCRNRSTNVKITIGNSTRSLIEWCEIFNLKFSTVSARYHSHENIGIDELFNSEYRGN